jgi:hypothetical protein
MIGCLSEHPPIALRVWGSREAIGYLLQDPPTSLGVFNCNTQNSILEFIRNFAKRYIINKRERL